MDPHRFMLEKVPERLGLSDNYRVLPVGVMFEIIGDEIGTLRAESDLGGKEFFFDAFETCGRFLFVGDGLLKPVPAWYSPLRR